MGLPVLTSGSGTSENTGKLFFFLFWMQSFDDLSMVLANLPRLSILPVHLKSSYFGLVEDVDAFARTTGIKTVRPRVCAIEDVSTCKDASMHCRHSFSPPHVPSLLNPYSWSD